MNPIDAKTSMVINCLVAAAGVVVGFTAPLTTIFGTGTAQTVVAAAGMAVAVLGAVNGVLHGYSSTGSGPLVAPPAAPPKLPLILLPLAAAALLGLLWGGEAYAQTVAQGGNRAVPAARSGLTGNPIQDIKNATTPAPSGELKLTGDPIADLHTAITKGGAKLILHLKQSYALAMAKGLNGGTSDNTSAMCTKALVPIVDLVVNGPKMGTLDPADPMNMTPDEVTLAADTSEPQGPIVQIEKLRILRLAVNSPALNDACGALVQDEIKNAQALVGKITTLITGIGLLPAGL